MPDILTYLKSRAEAEQETDPDEATAEDYVSALEKLGVNFDEENQTD